MKTKTLAVMTAALTLLATGLLAEGAQARKMRASVNQVFEACEAHGGSYYWGPIWGGYGCANQNGDIHCDFNGECEGERATPRGWEDPTPEN